MRTVLALLSCALLILQVQSVCEQLKACGNIGGGGSFFSDDSTLVSYANDALDMSSVCSELGAMTTCINNNNNKDSCPFKSVRKEVVAIRDVIEWLCTPEGIQVAQAVESSPCIDDIFMEVRVNLMMQSCLSDFQLNLELKQMDALTSGTMFKKQDACPFVSELNSCVIDGSRSRCGEEMATLVRHMWNIVTNDEFTEFGCSLNSLKKRHILRRAIPILMKRAALNKKLRK